MKKRVQLARALTEKSYWDKAAFPEIDMEVNLFQNVFEKYLIFAPSKTLLEVGCGGGGFLALIAKKYKYKIFGVDYSESIELTRAVFKREGLIEPTLFKADFFNWEPNVTFDVVCSFGFVEHFSNLSYV